MTLRRGLAALLLVSACELVDNPHGKTSSGSTNGLTTGASGTSSGSLTTATLGASSVGTSTGSTGTTTNTAGSTGSGFCAPATTALDNGDIGTVCIGQAPDGGFAQGSCAVGELCLAGITLNGVAQCTRLCDYQDHACPGTARCFRRHYDASSLDLCIPGCIPSSATTTCLPGQACYPSTPNLDEPGSCFADCPNNSWCNALGSTTNLTCSSSGVCRCIADTDCASGLSCDTATGVCYPPCTSACAQYVGCCGSTASVDFCDEGNVPSASGSTGGTGSFTVGPHTPWPQIPFHGGPVLENPEIITVLYSGYDQSAAIMQYANWIATSDWLSTVGSDYGVSPGSNQNIVLSAAAPPAVEDTGIAEPDLDGGLSPFQKSFDELLKAGTLPPPNPNTLYMVYFPSTTSISGDGLVSCKQFSAYNNSFGSRTVGGRVVYAMLPECALGDDGLVSLEQASSYELIEAATSPDVARPAWKIEGTSSPWAVIGGGAADLCAFGLTDYYDPSGLFVADRIWSNTAALGSGTPCIPAPPGGETFLGVSPVYGPDGGGVYALAPGQTLTLTVQAWSTAPAPQWYAGMVTEEPEGPDPVLAPVLPNLPVVTNGSTATFTVTMPLDAGSGDTDLLTVRPRDAAGLDSVDWPIVVYVP